MKFSNIFKKIFTIKLENLLPELEEKYHIDFFEIIIRNSEGDVILKTNYNELKNNRKFKDYLKLRVVMVQAIPGDPSKLYIDLASESPK